MVCTSSQIVHVIDDDESVRLSLDSLFRSVGLTTRTYVAAQDFLDDKHSGSDGCLILDIRLQGISGLDFQDMLIERNIHIPVILMTGHGDVPMSVRGMKAGAVDFLQKPFRDQDMLDAVASALKLDAKRRESSLGLDGLRRSLETLSARERQVMMLVTKGLLNKQVAHELGISEITVKIHRGSAMRKMQAKTLPDLVRMVERLKLN